MPATTHALPAGSLILVTGSTGFIAVHIVDQLLEAGYKVRGTVRSHGKGDYLKKLFEGKPFEYVLVPDVAEPHAFDEAVVGVDGVVHTASVVILNATDPDELIRPAVQGTISILDSIYTKSPSMRRLVITSSVTAINHPKPEQVPAVYDESDWSISPDILKEKGAAAGGSVIYAASKTLEEKEAWNFLQTHPDAKFDIAVINPSFVFGPILQEVASVDRLNTSVGICWSFCTGQKPASSYDTPMGNWVDVRDVAAGHVRALQVEEAGGNRFIVSNGPYNGQAFIDSIHPSHSLCTDGSYDGVPCGKPGSSAETLKSAYLFDGSKASRVLGIKYTPMDICIQDTYASVAERFGTPEQKEIGKKLLAGRV